MISDSVSEHDPPGACARPDILLGLPVEIAELSRTGDDKLRDRVLHGQMLFRLSAAHICDHIFQMLAKLDIDLLCLPRLPQGQVQGDLLLILTVKFLVDVLCHIRRVDRVQFQDPEQTVVDCDLP